MELVSDRGMRENIPIDEELEMEIAGDAGRHQARSLHDPKTPTDKERKDHELTHLPYRSWCTTCVAARGYALPHFHKDETSEMPTISMDYFYMGERDNPGCVCSLCIKEAKSKAVVAFTVPRKGRDEYSLQRVMQALSFMGHKRVIIKSDQEPAMISLIEGVRDRWTGELVHEKSPVGDHRANGWIEAGIRTVEAQIRALKLDVEKKYSIEIDHTSVLVPWIVEYASWIVTRFGIGRDGKTPLKILRGKDTTTPLCGFGECIQYRPAGNTRARGKLQSMLCEGIYLGKTHTSGECIIGTKDGIIKARDVYRKSMDERYNQNLLKLIRGTPWKTTPQNEVEGEEVPEFRVVNPGEPQQGQHAEQDGEAMPRRVKITREVLERFGYTSGCPGCNNTRLGRYHRAHSEQCRERLEEAIREDETTKHRIEAAHARQDAWMQREYARMGLGERTGQEARDEQLQTDSTDMAADAEVRTPPSTPNREPIQVPEGEGVPEIVIDDEYGGGVDTTPSRKRHRDIDDSLEQEDGLRGHVYERVEQSSSSSGPRQYQTVSHADVQSTELIEALEAYGVDAKVKELQSVNFDDSEATQVDVSEVYSPPRVVALAHKFGLRPGFSLDITVDDETGKPWDFDDPGQRHKAERLLRETQPWLLIGSPMCTYFSRLQNLNRAKMGEARFQREYRRACIHLEFCARLYGMQMDAGRYFLHEHPETASSWKEICIRKLLDRADVGTVVADMCQFGMEMKDDDGVMKPVLKPTRWLSNSPYLLHALNRRCNHEHEHTNLIRGRARKAQVYPHRLCTSILRGLRRQLLCDGVMSKTFVGSIVPEEEHGIWDEMDTDETWGEYYDVSGNALESHLVKAAREEEIQGLKSRGTYIKVPIAEAWERTGKPPIRTRFVDVNKGDNDTPNYRSRLVATELKAGDKRLDLFAGMPPLEAKKALFSLAATKSLKGKDGSKFKLGFIDVSKAYLYAPVRRDIYIELPEGDRESGMCGRLIYSLYGTRDAAQNWEAEYTKTLEDLGFARGKASPCTFWSEGLQARIVVHGDDFTILGTDKSIRYIEDEMRKKYQIKMRGVLGPDRHDCKEITILNRILRWTPYGLEYEPDPRHAEIIVHEMCVESGKPVNTPGAKREGKDGEPLNPEQSTRYRGLVARANYLAQDRADLQYAVKELSRRMSAPTDIDWMAMKRLARYLLGMPRVISKYPWKKEIGNIRVVCDSDWAGCHETRRSSSGGVLYMGEHVVKTWSVTQATVALSSGEAEYSAAVKGVSQALGFRSILRDLGCEGLEIACGSAIECSTDSSAAIGIASRSGLGKVRHVAVHLLWLQDLVRKGEVRMSKVEGSNNPADVLTKHVSAEILHKHFRALLLYAREGRATTAPQTLQ